MSNVPIVSPVFQGVEDIPLPCPHLRPSSGTANCHMLRRPSCTFLTYAVLHTERHPLPCRTRDAYALLLHLLGILATLTLCLALPMHRQHKGVPTLVARTSLEP